MDIWQSYKQERGCLMHFARLANTLLKDKESARDNHVFALTFVVRNGSSSLLTMSVSAILPEKSRENKKYDKQEEIRHFWGLFGIALKWP